MVRPMGGHPMGRVGRPTGTSLEGPTPPMSRTHRRIPLMGRFGLIFISVFSLTATHERPSYVGNANNEINHVFVWPLFTTPP